MSDTIHPVVKLLAKRMESHPEEFNREDDRWGIWLHQLESVITEEERVLLRGIRMKRLHEEVMDELLNGPERRAKVEADRAAYTTLIRQQAAQQKAAQMYNNQYTNAIGLRTSTPATMLGVSTNQASLNVGGETLTGDMLKKMKKAIGL